MLGVRIMKATQVTLTAICLSALSGCMVVPVSPGYYAAPPVYVAPAPTYSSGPAYYGPAIGVGIYGRGHGYRYR